MYLLESECRIVLELSVAEGCFFGGRTVEKQELVRSLHERELLWKKQTHIHTYILNTTVLHHK